MSLASNFQVEMIKNFGPNWYQEKTKDLKLHLGKFAGLVIDSFKVEEAAEIQIVYKVMFVIVKVKLSCRCLLNFLYPKVKEKKIPKFNLQHQ